MMCVGAPSVSVCIPVFNGATFIAEAVASVLAQTFREFELIVLDNASTDETPQILEQFQDDRMRVIRHSANIGAAANFNAALKAAGGDWVKILCADDLLYPNCLKKQVEDAVSGCSDGAVLLCAARDIIDAHGRRWMSRGFPGGMEGVCSGKEALVRSVRAGTNLFGEPTAVLMHRTTALQAGGFDPAWRFCIDLDLWARILQYGSVYSEPEELCAFRVSEHSLSLSLVHSQAGEFCDWMVRSRQAGLLKAGHLALLAGRVNAHKLMILRLLFYKMISRKNKRKQ